jgi:lipopolysaccharide/colanic/teichoic acid biosynthesis glycosyltransferase
MIRRWLDKSKPDWGPPAGATFEYLFLKRLFDVTVSSAGLVILAPLFAAVAVISWIDSGRPVLISQERVGRWSRRFRLYKFRTLPVSCLEESDCQWTATASCGWGRFLRATGLDELPQLLNVLRGEMSLVGPRPERPRFAEQFRRQFPLYPARHRLRPGITGWAQVHGLRGDTSIAERLEHDLDYLRHWSLSLDCRILWMTVRNLCRQLLHPEQAMENSAHARPL